MPALWEQQSSQRRVQLQINDGLDGVFNQTNACSTTRYTATAQQQLNSSFTCWQSGANGESVMSADTPLYS
jgi:hypothetical protein